MKAESAVGMAGAGLGLLPRGSTPQVGRAENSAEGDTYGLLMSPTEFQSILYAFGGWDAADPYASWCVASSLGGPEVKAAILRLGSPSAPCWIDDLPILGELYGDDMESTMLEIGRFGLAGYAQARQEHLFPVINTVLPMWTTDKTVDEIDNG